MNCHSKGLSQHNTVSETGYLGDVQLVYCICFRCLYIVDGHGLSCVVVKCLKVFICIVFFFPREKSFIVGSFNRIPKLFLLQGFSCCSRRVRKLMFLGSPTVFSRNKYFLFSL